MESRFGSVAPSTTGVEEESQPVDRYTPQPAPAVEVVTGAVPGGCERPIGARFKADAPLPRASEDLHLPAG